MVGTRWVAINTRLLAGLIAVICIIFAVYRGAGSFLAGICISPEELFAAALENTLNSNSCSFSMRVKLGDAVISDVQGKRVAPDSVHITGTMQDMPVEFIHTGNKTYIKGYWSESWSILEDNKMAVAELFVTEFNPLGNFNFKDVPAIKALKSEEINGKKLKLLELRPIVQNSLMELNYDDFIYRVWIDPQEQVIRKARIEARGKHGKKNKLEISLELWDFNKQFKIKPPTVPH